MGTLAMKGEAMSYSDDPVRDAIEYEKAMEENFKELVENGDVLICPLCEDPRDKNEFTENNICMYCEDCLGPQQNISYPRTLTYREYVTGKHGNDIMQVHAKRSSIRVKYD